MKKVVQFHPSPLMPAEATLIIMVAPVTAVIGAGGPGSFMLKLQQKPMGPYIQLTDKKATWINKCFALIFLSVTKPLRRGLSSSSFVGINRR